MQQIYRTIIKEKHKMELLIIYHILCLVLFSVSIYFVFQYFKKHDSVVIKDRAGNISACKTISFSDTKIVAEDIVKKAFLGAIDRSADQYNEDLVKTLYTKEYVSKIHELIDSTKAEFLKYSIVQTASIDSVQSTTYKGYPLVVLRGYITREGIYYNHPYSKKFKYVFAALLKRTHINDLTFPYQIFNVKYETKEIDPDEI